MDVASGATAARLEQARALSAGRNWDEAIDIFRQLAADSAASVVAIDDSRFISLRTYCQLQLARLPAEGLATYRHRVDPLAERWYRDGLANRDERLLRRVVDECFCSSWGDDSLLALGELALERGHYASARHSWEQISPLLRAPDGIPMWLALRDIDLKTKWPGMERRWQARDKQPDWLAYPDTQLDLAEIWARLVLVSIRAGEFDRARLELELLRRLHPNTAGQLGGQKENYATALERLLSTASEWPAVPSNADWPTFAGSQTRAAAVVPIGTVLVPAWKEPIQLSPPAIARGVQTVPGGLVGGTLTEADPALAVHESQRPLSCYPVAVDGVVVFADAIGIHAADLATGKPAIASSGLLYHNESSEEKRVEAHFSAAEGMRHGVPRLTLTVADGVLYGRVGALATSRIRGEQSSAGDRVIGLDLGREGLLTFRARPEDGSWSFDGTPVSDGRRLFVTMRHSEVTPHAYVACFDAATGTQQWRKSIGAADTPAAGAGEEITHNLLTLEENRIYFNTNLGLVAALDAENGDICWIRRYDRVAGKFTHGVSGPLHFDRDPSPCLYHDGLVFVAPSDAPTILAMDAETGKTVWQHNQLPDALHLLCVVGKELIVTGDRIAAVDFATGRIAWNWPDSASAGIRGMGRGVVAGNEVFWPTRDAIYVIDPKTGAQTRPPMNLAPLTGGANLAVSQGRLIVAGYDKLMVFGPPTTSLPKSAESTTKQAAVRTGRLSDQSETK